MRIGIDLMGSDNSPSTLIEGVVEATQLLDLNSSLLVFATQEFIAQFSTQPSIRELLQKRILAFCPVQEAIDMNDEPLWAIRAKKGSSLMQGIRLLKKRQLDGFVSAGNTGALVAAAALSLNKLPGISRPALLAIMPTKAGTVAVLDVGGNLSCKARHLVQFAHLGAAYQRCSSGMELPRVGLLNIGVESKKGTSELRQAYQILKEESQPPGMQKFLFVGNLEAREVFEGKVDVIVTDGFTGNVLLKAIEGASSFIFDAFQRACKEESLKEAEKIFLNLEKFFNYKEHPGAIICGVEGIVIKCHGNSSSKGIYHGIQGAINLSKIQTVNQLKLLLS